MESLLNVSLRLLIHPTNSPLCAVYTSGIHNVSIESSSFTLLPMAWWYRIILLKAEKAELMQGHVLFSCYWLHILSLLSHGITNSHQHCIKLPAESPIFQISWYSHRVLCFTHNFLRREGQTTKYTTRSGEAVFSVIYEQLANFVSSLPVGISRHYAEKH